MLTRVADRWYSEEYSSFYLDSSATTYVLHLSASGSGDAFDALNWSVSPANGHYFMMSGSCFDVQGPWWFTQSSMCGIVVMFGKFWWYAPLPGDLQIARMMISQVV